ncbi:dihydrofolate reductase FolA [Thermoclostridium stercorarium subsp. stercorarium DSM 8532]|jgi:dihydrofolate reductase|uniref:dihydrofolate reductase n=3 Tax=Thermoclostridium stercorarium TaxID=1510 RepID=L7VLL7_THES1|nr:dihydrofolate reductase [Thermoclostridium stercorarium]AGC69085.1 dihydrofolate reductase FolA [Thermoclostridium stercorarium subsp. stercorarium DSM 8532]AGI40057.1 dihydrofolate reductase [Thermoclostridium stercorarium subsp. stercorarium DSM 8532]ANW99376.1 diacylglycerol kinase [Thermoclostridium stercorarium subsp. thermolacticum DSM 2910]ANX02005.1 diacylglycerol kinase [Thermoclostridium stercorarium subsp. leptospartum DSM 9219]UZQ85044.1 dihydrofolate reductase [Thermoclostridiu
MQEWIIIASADKNWGIGYKNKLLVKIPEDMKHVSAKTTGKVIVMGRKTLESFPGGRPLPNRTNVVLTTNVGYKVEGAVVVHSIQELMDELKDYDGEIYVFGGESIYRQLMPYCTKAYITRINKEFQADSFLPCLDEIDGWKLIKKGRWQTSREGIEYRFDEYIRSI